ncbi:MAG: beta-propeller fold lactonase family protein [Candidatus Hydrogenedentes bacterium]|nr:beta-propeller fold lactonase family protein [Candidatus Hydrogenedentota bacterium]
MVAQADTGPVDEKHTGGSDARRRLIYNSDGDNMFLYKAYPMQPADVLGYVDEIGRAGATSLFISPNVGMNVNFPGKASEMLGARLSPAVAETIKDPAATKPGSLERTAVNLRALVDAGHDPLGLIVARAKEKGLETFLTFRLNEVHAVDESDSILLSRFWKEHPDWRIGKPGDALSSVYVQILGPRTHPVVGSWLPGGLNYAVPEVRQQRLAELRECCERYPIDGLDLDFQRFPMYFSPGKESENVAVMTGWMRDVRRMTREIGQERGRPVRLSVRIMALPEQNRAIGIDPIAWAKEGIVDFVTVSHYLRNDFPLPVREYRRVFPAGLPIYASIEVEPSKDTYRRIARWLWEDGADGLMVYNFFTTREGGKEPPFELLNELGDPRKLPPDQDVLLVLNKHEDTISFVNPRTLEPIAKIPTGPNPHEIVLSKDSRFAYLSNYAPPGNTVSVIDLVERKHVAQISTGEYSRIHGAAMAPDGKHAYFTAGQTGFVVEIDTQTNKVTRGIPTHGKISHMVLVSHDNKRLYTANIDTQNVSVIDRESGALITQIPCGKGCEGMAFTPDRKQLWALNQEGDSITIIDLATHTPVKTIPCPGKPVRIRFTLDGRRALVSSWTEKGEVVVLDVATLTEIKCLPVGSRAIGLELSPDGKHAFAGCEETDGVHVIDLDSLTVTGKFQTGNGSDSMAWWTPPN